MNLVEKIGCFLVKSGKIAEIVQVSNKAVQDYIFPEKSLSYRYYYLIPKSIYFQRPKVKPTSILLQFRERN